MSKDRKTTRANQARLRRATQKQRLETLKEQVNTDGVSKKHRKEYLLALAKRKLVLNGAKKYAAKHRNKLKTYQEKAEKSKQTKRKYNLKCKAQGKEKNWKAGQRCRKRFALIKQKIEIERNDINSRCMKFRRSKMTPLGAAVRYCDLAAVRYLLELKASPSLRCTATLVTTPLYDAA